MIFGGTSLHPDELKDRWMSIISTQHWVVKLDSVQLPGQSSNLFKASRLLFDSGSTFSFMPQADFDTLVNHILLANFECKTVQRHLVCPHDDSVTYPTFTLIVGDVRVDFGPNEYFWDYGEDAGLFLAVKPQVSTKWTQSPLHE